MEPYLGALAARRRLLIWSRRVGLARRDGWGGMGEFGQVCDVLLMGDQVPSGQTVVRWPGGGSFSDSV